jgi:hypothetical protein
MTNLGMGRNMRLQFVFNIGEDSLQACGTFDPLDPYEVSDLVN